jgi:hypothetical protein
MWFHLIPVDQPRWKQETCKKSWWHQVSVTLSPFCQVKLSWLALCCYQFITPLDTCQILSTIFSEWVSPSRTPALWYSQIHCWGMLEFYLDPWNNFRFMVSAQGSIVSSLDTWKKKSVLLSGCQNHCNDKEEWYNHSLKFHGFKTKFYATWNV